MKYVGSRLLQAMPLLLLVSVAAFVVMHIAPGGPTAVYLRSPLASGANIAARRAEMGLTDPLPVQYARWLTSMLRGDWGNSYVDGRPVLAVILERVPATLLLISTASAIAFVLALLAGILGAFYSATWLDHALTIVALFAWAMPVFWLGLLAQQIFAVDLDLFPVAGLHATDASDVLDLLHHLALPALVLGLTSVAGWSRYLRSSLVEVLAQPYVTTARAKGASFARSLIRHALPNALIPFVTVLGLDVPRLFTGAVVTETIFAWPGMGRLFFDSLGARDYPVEMGLLMITAVLIVLANLGADLLIAALDPRVRLGVALP